MVSISIIVPVYNSEKYLNDCLESLSKQTLGDIEIIIVNDGSSDNSQVIIEQYTKKDSRFISIYQNNAGPGEARNRGIEIAKGKYVGFVDSDDKIVPEMYEKMLRVAETKEYDIVSCNYVNLYQDGSLSNLIYKINKTEVNIEKYGLSAFLESDILELRFGSEVWSKIIKKSIITEKLINFKSHKEILGEDILFLLECLFEIQSIGYLNESLYYHRFREGSLTNSNKPNMANRFLLLTKIYQEKAIEKNKENEVATVLPYLVYSYIGMAVENEKGFKQKKLCISSVVEEEIVIKSMKYIYRSKKGTLLKRITAKLILNKRLDEYIFLRILIEKIAKLKRKVLTDTILGK